jgi:internalin A
VPEDCVMRPIRLRMSVRVLMMLVLLVGGVMGWWVHRARVQRDAVAEILRARGKVHYDWEVSYVPASAMYQPNPSGKPLWPRWLITRLGPDYFSDVKVVRLGPDDADAVMAAVGRLKTLGSFIANSRHVKLTDAGLAHLRGLAQLRFLDLSSSRNLSGGCLAIVKDLKSLQRLSFPNARFFVDADLAPLAELTDLRFLCLRGPGIHDAGLAHLRGLVNMHSLDLMDTQLTGVGLDHLRSMTRLESLYLDRTHVEKLDPVRHFTRLRSLSLASTPIADAALAELKGLDQLETLDLSGTRVTDAGLEHLRGLKKLRTLRVRGTTVSSEAVAALRKELPLLAPEPPTPKRLTPSPKAKAADPTKGARSGGGTASQ